MIKLNQKIHIERIQNLLSQQTASSVVSLILAILLYSGYYDSQNSLGHWWVALQILNISIRLIYLHVQKKRSQVDPLFSKLNQVETIYSLMVAFTCLLWGLTSYIFLPLTSKEFLPLLFGMYFGVLVGGISRTDISFKVSKAYIFGFTIPFIMYGLTHFSKANFLLSLCTAIFAAFLYASLKKQYLHYLERANLTEENIAMADELKHKLELEKELQREKAINFQNAKLASIGELSAGIAHEINNPLSIAMGYLLTLKNDKSLELPEQQKEKLEKVKAAHTRIKNIVKGLRNFSRLDNTEKEEFNLSQTIEESVLFVKEIYLKQGVHIEMSLEENISLYGNQGEIQQVVMNLLSNARDAVEDAEFNTDLMLIQIKLHKIDDRVIFSMQDNGSGIPDNVKDQIFDPFFTTKRVSKGTGIGLAICHRIVEDHAGVIEIQSEQGHGTTFQLSFPASIPQQVGQLKAA